MPAIAHKLIDGLRERDRAFYSAIEAEDDLGLVIRGQIHIENELHEFIMAVAPRPDHVKFGDMEYSAKIRLALVLGLSTDLSRALSAIGSLRNDFAHKVDMNLNKSHAANIYNSFGSVAKNVTQKTYGGFRLQYPDKKFPKKMCDMAVRDQIAFYFISVRAGVIANRLRLEGKV